MKAKKYIITGLIVIFLANSLYTNGFAKGNLSKFDLLRDNNNKINIVLESNSDFRYFINSENNNLNIDIRDINLSNQILERISAINLPEMGIKQILIEYPDNETQRIKLVLENLKSFLFTVNAPNGTANPYGFKYKSYILPKKNNKNKNKKNSNKNSSLLSVNKKQSKPELTNDSDIIMPESPQNKQRNLSEDTTKSEKANPQIISRNETSEKPEPSTISEITEDETTADKETTPIHTTAETRIKEEKINPTKENELITSVTSIPKGKFAANVHDKNAAVAPVGSKIIEISPPAKQQENITEEKTDYYKIIKEEYQPRELNYMPLGISEHLNFINAGTSKQAINPITKPPMYSDNTLGFKVITSKGEFDGTAAKKQIEPYVQPNTYAANQPSKLMASQNADLQYFKKQIQNGTNYINAGDYFSAEKSYKNAILSNPELPWGYIAIASFYDMRKQYQEAINAYKKAGKLLPNKAELLYNIAIDYYKLGDARNSEANFKTVIDISPEFILAYYNLGTLYYKMEDYDSSVDCLSKATKMNPLLTDGFYNLSLALIAIDEYNLAEKKLQACINIDSEDTQCKSLLEKIKNQNQ